MARSIAVAAVLLALVASAAAVGTNEPTASPTSPTAAPTTPTAAPTTPTAAPTTPTAAPTTPTAAPTTPTAAPTTPTAAPTSPTAAPTTPTVAPTSPTVAPTPTPSPTPAPVPATCSSKAQYRAPGGCNNCVSRSSPYTKVFGGSLCYNPTTLSSQSTVCTPHVLPAFIRSNIDKSKTVSCINPQKKLVTLFLVTKNSNIDFLSSAAYIKTSLRLAGAIPPVKLSNGAVKYIKSNGRILVQFEDTFGVLRKKYGLTVQLTGSLKHGPGLLNQCFNAFLKVCG